MTGKRNKLRRSSAEYASGEKAAGKETGKLAGGFGKGGRESAEEHKSRGRMHMENGRYAEAIEDFKAAMDSGCRDGGINAELGRIYERLGDYGKALEELKEAENKGCSEPDIHKDLGRIYTTVGRYDLAIAEFERAIRSNPESGEYYRGLGTAHVWNGEYTRAEECLLKALGLGCSEEDARLELAKIYSFRDDQKSALEELGRILDINPSNGKALELRGRMLVREGEYSTAVDELEEAVRLGQNMTDNLIRLGEIYRENGEPVMAVQKFRAAAEVNPDGDSLWFKNRVMNEIELTERKTELRSKPRSMGVVLTTKCNLDCLMCEMKRHNLDISEKTSGMIMEYLPYLESVLWIGGEVFFSRYFETLFDKAAECPGLSQTIVTNGLLIDDKWAEKFSGARVNINFSIDGFTKNTYERVRRGARFEKLIENIGRVNKAGERSSKLKTTFRFTILKSNVHEIGGAVDFACRYGFSDVTLIHVHHYDCGENLYLHGSPKTTEFIEKEVRRLREQAAGRGIALHSRFLHAGRTEDLRREAKNEIQCYWPWQHLFVDIVAGSRPSCRCLVSAGDPAKCRSLDDIWNGSIMRQYRENIVKGCYRDMCDREMSEFECLKSPISGGAIGLPEVY
ncbi:MAG: tetratricopeptide repeat protein [Elusimicrobia bacterium]|nr:tetratricopeptide repeat protein [Elusimicrobiota bacterium]